MTLRLMTAALACGLATAIFPTPANAGGIAVRVGNRGCSSRYYSVSPRYHRSRHYRTRHYHRYRAPRRTVIVDQSYYNRPRVSYRSRNCNTKVRHYGYTYRGDGQYYPRVSVRSNRSCDRPRVSLRSYRSYNRPRVVYSSRRGYSRNLDRHYVRTRRGGSVHFNVDFD